MFSGTALSIQIVLMQVDLNVLDVTLCNADTILAWQEVS